LIVTVTFPVAALALTAAKLCEPDEAIAAALSANDSPAPKLTVRRAGRFRACLNPMIPPS
jgi:hypothetical protein